MLAILAMYLTWYSDSDSNSTISVNGFRSSIWGDLYFVAAIGVLAMVAADVTCEAKNVDDVELTVRKEYEAAFREQNADLIGKVPPP